MIARICFRVPDAKPTFDNRGHLSGLAAWESVQWDVHEIEDEDDVLITHVGCVHVTNTTGNIHIYPVANVVKIEVTP